MVTKESILKGTSYKEAYDKFLSILEEDGANVFNAYLTIFKSDRPLPEGMNLSREELLEIAELVKKDYYTNGDL